MENLTTDFLILCLCFLAIAILDSVGDAIRRASPLRPVRDFWHIVKHLNRATLMIAGYYLINNALSFSVLQYSLLLIWIIVLKLFVWNIIYYNYWMACIEMDEKVKITTGIKRLDKFIGLHQ